MKRNVTAAIGLGLLLLSSCASARGHGYQAANSSSAAAKPAPPSALKALDAASVEAYQAAVAANLKALPCRAPVILNDFLNMTLYMCDGRQEPFKMDTKRYFLMARTAHAALAAFSLAEPAGDGVLTSGALEGIRAYIAFLPAAREQVTKADVDEKTRDRLLALLDSTSDYLGGLLRNGRVDQAEFDAYAARVRPLIQDNLHVGAEEQLRQFRDQLNKWRTSYPKEHWGDLRVVVMGFHQARDLYATQQLFRWLLREDGPQNRVVYAEYQFSPFDRSDEAKKLALELLSKVDLDHRAATALFGNPNVLQQDVMGPAATEILRQWGASDWP